MIVGTNPIGGYHRSVEAVIRLLMPERGQGTERVR